MHSHIGQHPNIIEWFATGEDSVWKWIAMEYASGGDLFDKIEADVGVIEDIAHLYFMQLISGVNFMHAKGVAHRDLKPENILLSDSGDLKIADFGLATLFEYQGQKKLSATMCGSPPYIAPEVITSSKSTQARGGPKAAGYAANLVDIWSCGVVLFVLLVGNTPWDEPTSQSWEFEEYCRNSGRSTDELWNKLPTDVLSLLRGMMNVDPKKRFNMDQIKHHLWYQRKNSLATKDGKMKDPLALATQMLESMKIDFSQQLTASQQQPARSQDAMDIDSDNADQRISYTQPETPINDIMFDWERPTRGNSAMYSASQPVNARDGDICTMNNGAGRPNFEDLADEPSMSQFTANPKVPLSATQFARQFKDILPGQSLTRFFSHVPSEQLLHMLSDALIRLNVSTPPNERMRGRDGIAWIPAKMMDGRKCPLNGDIIIDTYRTENMELLEVRFVKIKGDPLEWRRFFKNVVILCNDGVYKPEA